jgi:hypothetical protein
MNFLTEWDSIPFIPGDDLAQLLLSFNVASELLRPSCAAGTGGPT